jgi:hypothetical protein
MSEKLSSAPQEPDTCRAQKRWGVPSGDPPTGNNLPNSIQSQSCMSSTSHHAYVTIKPKGPLPAAALAAQQHSRHQAQPPACPSHKTQCHHHCQQPGGKLLPAGRAGDQTHTSRVNKHSTGPHACLTDMLLQRVRVSEPCRRPRGSNVAPNHLPDTPDTLTLLTDQLQKAASQQCSHRKNPGAPKHLRGLACACPLGSAHPTIPLLAHAPTHHVCSITAVEACCLPGAFGCILVGTAAGSRCQPLPRPAAKAPAGLLRHSRFQGLGSAPEPQSPNPRLPATTRGAAPGNTPTARQKGAPRCTASQQHVNPLGRDTLGVESSSTASSG